MSRLRHLDPGSDLALGHREWAVNKASEPVDGRDQEARYLSMLGRIKQNRVYIWSRQALENFTKFWAHSGNYGAFLRDFAGARGVVFRRDLIGNDFHFFPAPGALMGLDTLAPEFRKKVAMEYFPPTTRCLGTTVCELNGQTRIIGLIHTIHADPSKFVPTDGTVGKLEPLRELPATDSPEGRRLTDSLESRCPTVIDGMVWDRKAVEWVLYVYRLQIFLMQPFIGTSRPQLKGGKKGVPLIPGPPPEIVRVLMRQPLPAKLPRYVIPSHHPITGHKLEFEVDVRGHLRHCASGKVVPVREHKRGPKGKSREKVIKVVR